ncbi:hypothetical protein PG984_016261 [Apiospora sp. TS-2023a]
MAERKVLSKYYPPDFDPRQISQRRQPKEKTGPKLQTVRLGAPFSLCCLTCGEYIGKGRRFNARKETNEEETYLGIPIFRFYIRCPRCSAEITFKTDPKLADYACEKGAKRNGGASTAGEIDEQRLDRLEKECQDEEEQERDALVQLENKADDAKREMAVADALDEIRIRNSRTERIGSGTGSLLTGSAATLEDDEKAMIDREDAEAARRAFAAKRRDRTTEEADETVMGPSPPPFLSFTPKRPTNTKPNIKGIKKKRGMSECETQGSSKRPRVARDRPKGSLVDYGSDEDS